MSGHSKWNNIKRKKGASDAAKAKVFTKMRGNFQDQIGRPDLIVLFTGTVSHKMAGCAMQAARQTDARIARCASSSSAALDSLLRAHCAGN